MAPQVVYGRARGWTAPHAGTQIGGFSGAPEPTVASTILWQDNFNKATLAELVAPYAKRGVFQLITDGRSGNAIRFPYSSASSDNVIEYGWSPTVKDIYFRYWYRLSIGADPSCGGQNPSGMKWFMPWRITTNLRYTMGVGTLDTGGPPGVVNTGLEFSSHDNTSIGTAHPEPAPFMQNISKAKTFKNTADYQWHKYTLHVVTDAGLGTGADGYEQIWVDDVKITDTRPGQPFVPGPYDHNPDGIGLFQFPGLVVTWFAGYDFTIDADDLVVWHN